MLRGVFSISHIKICFRLVASTISAISWFVKKSFIGLAAVSLPRTEKRAEARWRGGVSQHGGKWGAALSFNDCSPRGKLLSESTLPNDMPSLDSSEHAVLIGANIPPSRLGSLEGAKIEAVARIEPLDFSSALPPVSRLKMNRFYLIPRAMRRSPLYDYAAKGSAQIRTVRSGDDLALTGRRRRRHAS